MKKIMFTGGGTLGHIFPMMPVIEELKKRYPDYQVMFFGSKTGLEKKLLSNHPFIDEAYWLDIEGLKRKLTLQNINVLFKYYQAKRKANKILQEIRPDVVIGMGGYVSAPVVKEASKLKIATIIHEQNSYLGLANKLLIKKVDKVLLAFPLPKKIKNSQVIGNPRSSEVIRKAKNYVKSKQNSKILLVVGGSRGAQKINELTLKIVTSLKLQNIKTILITGNKYYNEHKDKLLSLVDDYFEVIPFTNEIIKLINEASVVVSRSGATTLFELMALKKICLLIPSPNVTNNHQLANANYFKDKGCTIVI